MQKQTVTVSQAICVLSMFLFGSSVVMGVSTSAAQDSWIALLAAFLMAIPVFLLYARIMRLYPERDLYEIMELLFGKILGKIFILIFCWYALHLCALVLRNFSEFMKVVAMPETPELSLMIIILVVALYLAKSGAETLGKWGVGIFVVVNLIFLFTFVLSFGYMDLTNLLPLFEHDLPTILKNAFQILSFPFAEGVLFLCMADSVKKEDSPFKIYLYAILITTLILILVILRNIWTLGAPMMAAEYFPSYTTARIIGVGDFLTRIEGSISMNFILAGLTKIALCLIAAAKGIARLFGLKSRAVLAPVASLTLALCAIVYENIMQMFDFLRFYQYYAIPFQFVIPLIVWITAEIKSKNKLKPLC